MCPFVNKFQGMLNKLAHYFKVNASHVNVAIMCCCCIRLCPESLKVTTSPEEVISQSYQMNKRCPTVSERDALGLAKVSQHNFIKYIIRYQSCYLFIYLFCSFHSI
jgi:hypothetical protein